MKTDHIVSHLLYGVVVNKKICSSVMGTKVSYLAKSINIKKKFKNRYHLSFAFFQELHDSYCKSHCVSLYFFFVYCLFVYLHPEMRLTNRQVRKQ